MILITNNLAFFGGLLFENSIIPNEVQRLRLTGKFMLQNMHNAAHIDLYGLEGYGGG